MRAQAAFNLSYTQLGLLPAMYMAGLMIACVVLTELCNYVNSFRLVGVRAPIISLKKQSLANV